VETVGSQKTGSAAIRTIVEQKELEIAQTCEEIDALRTIQIGFAQDIGAPGTMDVSN
jgi:hypothetical protein